MLCASAPEQQTPLPSLPPQPPKTQEGQGGGRERRTVSPRFARALGKHRSHLQKPPKEAARRRPARARLLLADGLHALVVEGQPLGAGLDEADVVAVVRPAPDVHDHRRQRIRRVRLLRVVRHVRQLEREGEDDAIHQLAQAVEGLDVPFWGGFGGLGVGFGGLGGLGGFGGSWREWKEGFEGFGGSWRGFKRLEGGEWARGRAGAPHLKRLRCRMSTPGSRFSFIRFCASCRQPQPSQENLSSRSSVSVALLVGFRERGV